MPRTMAPRTQNLTIARIESALRELGERLNVVDMEDNLGSAALANCSVVDATVLTFVPTQEQRRSFPLAVFD